MVLRTRRRDLWLKLAEREGIRTLGWRATAAGMPAAALTNGDLSQPVPLSPLPEPDRYPMYL